MKLLSRVWLFATPWTVACRLLCPWGFPGKNTGVDSHFLLQGFLTQESNRVSCTSGRLFTIWATREALVTLQGAVNIFPFSVYRILFPCPLMAWGKGSACSAGVAGDTGSIPGLGSCRVWTRLSTNTNLPTPPSAPVYLITRIRVALSSW